VAGTLRGFEGRVEVRDKNGQCVGYGGIETPLVRALPEK